MYHLNSNANLIRSSFRARVTESLAQPDVSFCRSKVLYILDYVNFVRL